jgi:hypothetical protein
MAGPVTSRGPACVACCGDGVLECVLGGGARVLARWPLIGGAGRRPRRPGRRGGRRPGRRGGRRPGMRSCAAAAAWEAWWAAAWRRVSVVGRVR